MSFQARATRHEGRSWLHLDLYTNQQEAEVERLIGLGHPISLAVFSRSGFVVLQDPDGNLFCVVQKPDAV